MLWVMTAAENLSPKDGESAAPTIKLYLHNALARHFVSVKVGLFSEAAKWLPTGVKYAWRALFAFRGTLSRGTAGEATCQHWIPTPPIAAAVNA